MTDRELLELAAKAAGMDGFVWRDDRASMFHYNSKMMCWYRDSYSDLIEWNPLTDDGDALRLAVKLGILVSPNEGGKTIAVLPTDDIMVSNQIIEPHGKDPYAATRRAIVRAAAAIGKEMKC